MAYGTRRNRGNQHERRKKAAGGRGEAQEIFGSSRVSFPEERDGKPKQRCRNSWPYVYKTKQKTLEAVGDDEGNQIKAQIGNSKRTFRREVKAVECLEEMGEMEVDTCCG